MPVPLYLLAVAIFAMGTSEFMLGGLTPDLARSLGVSVGTAGLLTTAFALGMIIGAPTMAALVRRWNPRTSLLVFLTIFAAAHVIGAWGDHFGLLLAMRLASALANAGFLAVALGIAGTLAGPDRAGRAIGVLLAGTTLATVIGVPAGAALGALLDWRATFWAVALLCVPAAIGILAGIPGDTLAGAAREVDLRGELAELRRPRLRLAMLLGALVNGSTFATFTYLAPIVTGRSGLGEAWVPGALMIFGIGSFAGVSIASRVSDHRPLIIILGGGPMLVLAWCAVAVAAGNPPVLFVVLFVSGALSFAVGSTLIARVLRAAPGAPTMGGAYATVAFNLGAAAGPAAAGLAFDAAGALGPVWVSACLTFAAVALAALARRRLVPYDSERAVS